MTVSQIGQYGHTAFVEDGDSREDTAVILVGTAREHGLDDVRGIRATQGGFFISDELADLLYDEQDEPEVSGNAETKEEPKATKGSSTKTSGNRAAKNSTTEQE